MRRRPWGPDNRLARLWMPQASTLGFCLPGSGFLFGPLTVASRTCSSMLHHHHHHVHMIVVFELNLAL